MRAGFLILLLGVATTVAASNPISTAVDAVNAFGIDLLRHASTPAENFFISPYSIQRSSAMIYAGADGKTRDEMQKALHFPKTDEQLHRAFEELHNVLEAATAASIKHSESAFTLRVADRLFAQSGYRFDSKFLATVKRSYGAPVMPLDFNKKPASAAKAINAWVEEQTDKRIKLSMSAEDLKDMTLVVVNAIYLKARWAEEFPKEATKPQPFHLSAGKTANVPTMRQKERFGYLKGAGFQAVTLTYLDGDCHFVIILPDAVHGLAELEKKLTTDMLAQCARLTEREIILHLPKFKIEPPALKLSSHLRALGMISAFDAIQADFTHMKATPFSAPLFVGEVFHSSFIKVDEEGTEAAASTAYAIAAGAYPEQPIEVKVDRPFLFAIQHRTTGTCLFLGHVADPR